MELYINEDPQPPNVECITSLREDLPPEVLYSNEVIKGPTMLFRILRDYLSLKGLTYSQHPMSNRISHGLVNMFYVDPSEQHLAMQNFAPPQASNSVHHNQASSSPTQGTMSNVTSDQKLAHNVASRFKREDRYTG